MARLIAISPCANLLPRTIGALTLTEVDPGPVTSVAPFRGREEAVSAALAAALGICLPGPNELTARGEVRALWAGRGRALVMGAEVPEALGAEAALTDQSDAFAMVRIEGDGVEAALARMVPVDLRPAALPPGTTLRTLVGHMTASVTRVGGNAIEIAVMRSMAGTLVHELVRAATSVTTRDHARRG